MSIDPDRKVRSVRLSKTCIAPPYFAAAFLLLGAMYVGKHNYMGAWGRYRYRASYPQPWLHHWRGLSNGL